MDTARQSRNQKRHEFRELTRMQNSFLEFGKIRAIRVEEFAQAAKTFKGSTARVTDKRGFFGRESFAVWVSSAFFAIDSDLCTSVSICGLNCFF